MNLPCYLAFISLLHSSFIIITSADFKCPESFHCGNLTMEFPFTGTKNPSCGLLKVDGCDSGNPRILSETAEIGYIRQKNSTNKLLIYNPRLQTQLNSSLCQSILQNIYLPQSPSVSFTISPNITFYICPISRTVDEYFDIYSHIGCSNYSIYYNYSESLLSSIPLPKGCSVMQLPKNGNRESSDLFYLLSDEFILEWDVSESCNKCRRGGGYCVANSNNDFSCRKGKKGFKNIFIIGGVAAASLTLTSIILMIYIRRRFAIWFRFRTAKPGEEEKNELFFNNENFALVRYRYSEIEKMTKSFSEKLGQGGYGSVYKGSLSDGRLVAVKILNVSTGNGEEFMNEIVSITKTSHINIVTLLGFCFQGSKRALIYDFMPNGSLEKFVSSSQVQLGWQKLLDITLGVARGLEYLHQGCNTRILHLDIKPHNILLDKDLNPRISDFGLAKLCPNRSSEVSMSVARGSRGYIAPEVLCRGFGEVSHKSDVYSFGVMVLEIGGGLKNFDPQNADCTSEFYFSLHAYKQLEMEGERGDDILFGDVDRTIKMKLMIVGLWCVQMDPMDRPSMMKVVDMLEGDFGSLQVPPKPYLTSPPKSNQTFSSSYS